MLQSRPVPVQRERPGKLLDRLFDVNVLTYDDKEFIRTERATSEKNRALVDTVMNKGDQASSEMIHLLCGIDPCLSKKENIYMYKRFSIFPALYS
uniref:CARD domain-containing protein n=1 Tax=Cyprinodon variegatus TaxID=28743 RepID=A0A3Q2D200_CYPVA